MSRLWNNLKTKLWPLPPGAIGISVGKNSVMAIRALRNEDSYRITHIVEETLPFSPFSNTPPREGDCASLSQAMQRIAASIPQTYWPLQIALPDPAAIFQVMDFDVIPQSPDERAAIARFRLEKEYPSMPQMDCATQVINEKDGPRSLLALFIQRAWLECMNQACRAVGYVPSVTDMTINYLFNQIYDTVREIPDDGILVSIDRDTWSILFWDASHSPRFVRSRWRDVSGADDDLEAIAQDIERLIMSYVLRVPGRRVGGVHLCAAKSDAEQLAAHLDKRMQIPCIPLDADKMFSTAPGLSIQDISFGILAVAVPRT